MSAVLAPMTLYKLPSESRIYVMDFTNLLGSTTIDSVTRFTSEIRGGGSSGLIFGVPTIIEDGKKVQFTISGGVHKNTYRVGVIVVTDDEQILEGAGFLVVTNY